MGRYNGGIICHCDGMSTEVIFCDNIDPLYADEPRRSLGEVQETHVR
jgi:hypothetical protein